MYTLCIFFVAKLGNLIIVPLVREVSILPLCSLDWFTNQLCVENLCWMQCVTHNRKEVVLAAIVFQFIFHLCCVSDG